MPFFWKIYLHCLILTLRIHESTVIIFINSLTCELLWLGPDIRRDERVQVILIVPWPVSCARRCEYCGLQLRRFTFTILETCYCEKIVPNITRYSNTFTLTALRFFIASNDIYVYCIYNKFIATTGDLLITHLSLSAQSPHSA